MFMINFLLFTLIIGMLIYFGEVKNDEAELPWTKPSILNAVHRRGKKSPKERYAPYGVAKPGKLPYYASAIPNPPSIVLNKSNKYLVHMQRKLIYALHNPQTHNPDKIVDCLLSRSKTYLVFGLTQSDHSYFGNKTLKELMEDISDVRMKLRTKSIDLTVKRFYLPKKVTIESSGEQLKYATLKERYAIQEDNLGGYIPELNSRYIITHGRPIGAPDNVAKIVLNMMVHIVNEYNFIHLRDYQHGFRPQFGVATACLKLREILIRRHRMLRKEGKDFFVHEFDLKGFFNQVNPYFTLMQLAKGGLKAFAVGIELLNSYMIPDYSESGIKEETEIKGDDSKGLSKSGFTQGSPLSPPLSMLGFDKSGVPDFISGDLTDDLVMYADDGVLITDKKITRDDFDGMFNYMATKSSGVLLARDKYFGEVKEGNFKFLGIDGNINDMSVTIDNKRYLLIFGSEEEGKKRFSKAKLYQATKEGRGRVRKDSLLDKSGKIGYKQGGTSLIPFYNNGVLLLNRISPLTGYFIKFTGYIEEIWDPSGNKAGRYYSYHDKKGRLVNGGIFNTNTASSLAAETMVRILGMMDDRTGIIKLSVEGVTDIKGYERHLIDRRRILHKVKAVDDYGVKGVMYYYHKDFADLEVLKRNKSVGEYQGLHPSNPGYL